MTTMAPPKPSATELIQNPKSKIQNLFDPLRVRSDFPILSRLVRGKPLVYLDSAATSQKPSCVIRRIEQFYSSENANIHRGLYALSEAATAEYESVRPRLRSFLNAAEDREIVFVSSATEALNLVARSLGSKILGAGDEVLVSAMEHHSNIVPWQMICEERGARVRVIPMNDAGELLLDEYEKLLGAKSKIVAVAHQSNALGTINPIARMAESAHRAGAVIVVDGTQAAAHQRVDVRALGCDFYAISAHKIFGPTGCGALYGRAEILSTMPPYQGGGEMIRSVTFEKTLFRDIPGRFEAGTPPIAPVIGLGAALDYLGALDWTAVAAHEADLLAYATERLESIPGLRVIGTAAEKASIVSFVMDGIHPHDIGTILDSENVCIRAGHHCAQPVMDRLGVPATARASFAFYNTREEVDALVQALHKAVEIFR